MSSKEVEDRHLRLLDNLLAESGLQCLMTAPESPLSSSVSDESTEQSLEEEERTATPTVLTQEEGQLPAAEEIYEETPEVFPTPSLRRVLPDKIRKIEETNRIHTLPDEFRTRVDPQNIPKINHTAPQKYIEVLGEIVGCTRYKSSLAEFWFLDTLANLLRRAQNDRLDRPTQAVLILWFCEWMKEMQQFDAADRHRMMKRFQDNMLTAARFIAKEERLPSPTEAGVYYKSQEEVLEGFSRQTVVGGERQTVTFQDTTYQCALRDLTKILHYIFDLFSTDYQYELVRSIFTFTPEYVTVDPPYQMQNPKRMYAPLRTKLKKEKSPKKDVKQAKKGQKKNDTEEYLALLERKARDEREAEERDERDNEEWNLRSHILPLAFAATDDFFDKYWPQPVIEPDPEPEPEVKKVKGKGNK